VILVESKACRSISSKFFLIIHNATVSPAAGKRAYRSIHANAKTSGACQLMAISL